MIRGDRNGIRFSLSVVFNCSQKMALHECSNISIGSVQMYVVKCVQGQHFNAIKNNWSVIQTINQNHQNSSSKFENHSIFSAIILSVPKHTKIVRSKEQHSQLETSISPDRTISIRDKIQEQKYSNSKYRFYSAYSSVHIYESRVIWGKHSVDFLGKYLSYVPNTNIRIFISRVFTWAYQIFSPTNSTADIKQNMNFSNFFTYLKKFLLFRNLEIFFHQVSSFRYLLWTIKRSFNISSKNGHQSMDSF